MTAAVRLYFVVYAASRETASTISIENIRDEIIDEHPLIWRIKKKKNRFGEVIGVIRFWAELPADLGERLLRDSKPEDEA